MVTLRGKFKGVQGVGVKIIKKSRTIPMSAILINWKNAF